VNEPDPSKWVSWSIHEFVRDRKDMYSIRAHQAEKLCVRIVRRIDKWMNHGEHMCPLCHHHHNHEPDCPYVEAKAMINELPLHDQYPNLEE